VTHGFPFFFGYLAKDLLELFLFRP
jgi:hypothetical protein